MKSKDEKGTDTSGQKSSSGSSVSSADSSGNHSR